MGGVDCKIRHNIHACHRMSMFIYYTLAEGAEGGGNGGSAGALLLLLLLLGGAEDRIWA